MKGEGVEEGEREEEEVEGEAAEEPGRVEGASVAGWEGTRRSEKAKVSEEALRRKGGGGGPMERRTG
jgi:hypothetical protein